MTAWVTLLISSSECVLVFTWDGLAAAAGLVVSAEWL